MWTDGSLGYLNYNMQPTALSIILTAAFTLTVKPFPHGSFWITAPSFFFFLNKRKSILDSDVLLVNNNCKTQLKRDFFFLFFHSVYQLYAHVLCMFLQRLDEIL